MTMPSEGRSSGVLAFGRRPAFQPQRLPLHQVAAEEVPVEVRVDAPHDDALDVAAALEDARLAGEDLHVPHLGIPGQRAVERLVHRHRHVVVTPPLAPRVDGLHDDVPQEAVDLVGDRLLEAADQRRGHDHHRQAQRDGHRGDAHDQRAEGLALAAGDAPGDEGFEGHAAGAVGARCRGVRKNAVFRASAGRGAIALSGEGREPAPPLRQAARHARARWAVQSVWPDPKILAGAPHAARRKGSKDQRIINPGRNEPRSRKPYGNGSRCGPRPGC